VPVPGPPGPGAGLALGRRLNWHVGLITEAEMAAIAPLADVVSFDLVGDDETIREVYGLDRTVQDYVETYRLTPALCADAAPHHDRLRGGTLGHEWLALDLLESWAPTAWCSGLDSTPGTRYAGCLRPRQTPPPTCWPRRGCVSRRCRSTWAACGPGGRTATGSTAGVRAGVNIVVSPARRARKLAAELGLVGRRMREWLRIFDAICETDV